MTRSRIVTMEGKEVTRGIFLKRALLRGIPIDWLTFFFGRCKGLHDSASGTIVVSKSVYDELGQKHDE